MPTTAFSREAQAELDIEQWLERNAYQVRDDPKLERMPPKLRAKAADDIECSGCQARGAILVATGKQARTGRGVSQGHFRFGETGGTNPHHPLCDFSDDRGVREDGHMVNLAKDKSALTKLVRDLVCRGIRAGLFGQGDIRAMRLWFLQARTEHASTLDITVEDLKWCADLDRARVWPHDDITFRPEHGMMPGFDFAEAARRELWRRSAHLADGRSINVHFQSEPLQRAIKLAEHGAHVSVFDPTALRDKFEATVGLSNFAVTHLFAGSRRRPPEPLNGNARFWDGRANAFLALASLLLFKSDWDDSRASVLLAQVLALPSVADGLEGNVIGLNPFHDYRAWELVHEARRMVARRVDSRPVPEQIDAIKMQLEASFNAWQAARA
jgi:hypothetical protein